MPEKQSPEKLIEGAREKSRELELIQAKTEIAKWRRKYLDLAAQTECLESQVECLLAISDPAMDAKFKAARKGRGRPAALMLPANDWHVEERVFSERVNSRNAYDLDIARKRIERFYSKSLELYEWYSHFAPIGEVWHPLLGDLITGYIHEELMETNTLSPTEACLFVQEMILAGLKLWLKELPSSVPISIPVCVGNHGRTTQRSRIKTSTRNSYEWLTCKTMAAANQDSRVRWMVGDGYHNIQKVVGRTVRLHHGDGLRYYGGVGGITIPVNKAVSQWDKVYPADFDIFGHWHQFLYNYPKWISCGSLIGYSEYSVAIKAEFQHPTQTCIVIDPRYGITLCMPIFLEPPEKKYE